MLCGHWGSGYLSHVHHTEYLALRLSLLSHSFMLTKYELAVAQIHNCRNQQGHSGAVQYTTAQWMCKGLCQFLLTTQHRCTISYSNHVKIESDCCIGCFLLTSFAILMTFCNSFVVPCTVLNWSLLYGSANMILFHTTPLKELPNLSSFTLLKWSCILMGWVEKAIGSPIASAAHTQYVYVSWEH